MNKLNNHRLHIILFFLLSVITVITERSVPSYLKDGPELIQNKNFSEGEKFWKVSNRSGEKLAIGANGIEMTCDIQESSLFLTQKIDPVPPGMKLRIETTAMSDRLTPGVKKWHQPEIALLQYDGDGKRVRAEHEVISMSRPADWKTYKKKFIIHPDTRTMTVSIGMIRCKGFFAVKDISAYKVRKNPVYIYFQVPVLLLWGLFLLSLFYRISGGRINRRQTVALLLISVLIIIGTTMPRSARQFLKQSVETPVVELAVRQTSDYADQSGFFSRIFDNYAARLVHFSFFGLWAFLLFFQTRGQGFTVMQLLLYMSLFAGASEMTQFLADERGPHLYDFMVDFAGCCTGLLIAMNIRKENQSKEIMG